MTKYLLLAALLVGGVLGWVLHKKACPAINQVQNVLANPQTAIWEAIVKSLGDRYRKQQDSITAMSRRILALDKEYQDSLTKLTRKEHDDSLLWAQAKTPQDSATRCSAVLVDCTRRAAIAEARAQALQTQLGAQIKVASRRCGLSAGIIPVRVDYPFKPHVGASLGLLMGCQIW